MADIYFYKIIQQVHWGYFVVKPFGASSVGSLRGAVGWGSSVQFRPAFLFLVLLAGLSSGGAYGQRIRTGALPDSILVGDTVGVVLEVAAPGGSDIIFTQVPAELVGGFELFEPPETDTLRYDDSGYVSRFRMVLTCYDSGLRVVPKVPVLVRYSGLVDTLYSESAAVQVSLMPVDESLDGELRASRGPIGQGVVWAEVWPWLLLVLVVAGLGLGLYFYLRHRRSLRGEDRFELVEPEDTRLPGERALSELRDLLQGQAWLRDGVKEYYTELSESLRRFLHGAWGVRTFEETTGSIVAQLQRVEQCSVEQTARFQGLLSVADLVKFARHAPDEVECVDSAKRAIALVEEIDSQERRRASVASGGTVDASGASPGVAAGGVTGVTGGEAERLAARGASEEGGIPAAHAQYVPGGSVGRGAVEGRVGASDSAGESGGTLGAGLGEEEDRGAAQ